MFFKSKLFFGGVLFCVCAVVFLCVQIYRANQPQEPIIIYKTVQWDPHPASQRSEEPTLEKNDVIDDTEDIFTPVYSEQSTDFVDVVSTDTLISDADVQILENVVSGSTKEPSFSEPEEERFFGLTLDEIKEEIPVLEREIRTNLTRAVELYMSLRSTDELSSSSLEIAAWRDATWAEVKHLFYDASRQKIPRYVSYLRMTGVDNPLLMGGWISEMIEPLPMGVTYGGMSE